MRYALNNLQATTAGFGSISKKNVYKVCDQPHPELMQNVLKSCQKASFQEACNNINIIFDEGYNIVDLINTLTRVMQTMEFK